MKFPAAFLLVALPLLYAFRSSEPVEPASSILPDHIVLQTGKATVTSTGITVFADTVCVFICPKMANCFLPNNLSVSLRLVRDQESQSVRLFAFPGVWSGANASGSDSVSVRLGGQLYKVILTGQYTGETDRSFTGRALLQIDLL